MAITNFTNLKTTIANYLNRDDLTSYIPDFITLAESRMNNELRVREMETIDTSTTTVAGTQAYSLPTGFIEAKYVIFQSDPYAILQYKAPFDFFKDYNASVSSGRPSFFTIIGTEINLGVTPDSAKTLEIAFFKKLTALSDSNLTNTILTNYPDLYLYGALAESAPFLMQDERLDVWAKLYKEALRIANSSSENGRSASQNLQMSADVVV
ncbi:hypothetical protein N9M26_01110 [Alphaproteobacteria bacterium]|jgi:hypothetical protein|nr:hypothetical protein [Alphaproteobacteria bacterium]